MTVRVRCPAKINRFLAVGPADEHGYHPIRTRFQAVGLFDDLVMSSAATGMFESNVPLPAENTVTRAIRLFSELVHTPPVKVGLTKRIPTQAGLGGGSSNAAGTLRALQTLTGGLVSDHGLWEIATAIGADVPFFLVGGEAMGEGYGERLTPLSDGPEAWIVLVHLGVGVSTPEAYRALDAWSRALRDDDGTNDFEVVAPTECLTAKAMLVEHGATQALLCGSGSSVFGAFPEQADARRAAEGLADRWRVDVVPTLTRVESLQIEVERGL
ncbi:MAG TPA: 4-(cytidine 5'-diphospho)-2-C-methyl-D-erythritol kinase [Fimbriimonadaceae bacterium]|nr:4-(cytidine 5'-diphospho)-2-C-methyl-D-erythritol kinase [Fimbriimonadaceae bacterium]